MAKKDFLNKRFENKIIDKILLIIVFLIIFLSPPLILYTYLLENPGQEILVCNAEICKLNQIFAFKKNYTTTIKRPTKILIDYSVGRNMQPYYFLCTNNHVPIFRTQYHMYKYVQRDKQLIESTNSNIKITKNDSSVLLILLLNLIDILFIIYCIKYWLKHKSFVENNNRKHL